MDVVSLRFSCDVGWERSGREGWPPCMIKSRRGGRERPKGGRESDSPLRLHTLGTKSSLLPRPSCRVMLCPYTPSSSVCVLPPKSFLSSSSFNAVSMYIESFRVSSLITLQPTRHTGNVSRSQRNLRLEGYIHTFPRSTILRAERGRERPCSVFCFGEKLCVCQRAR